jgi:hypothetical protein
MVITAPTFVLIFSVNSVKHSIVDLASTAKTILLIQQPLQVFASAILLMSLIQYNRSVLAMTHALHALVVLHNITALSVLMVISSRQVHLSVLIIVEHLILKLIRVVLELIAVY